MTNPEKAIDTILAKEGYIYLSDIAKVLKVRPEYVWKWQKGMVPNLKHSVMLGKRFPYVRKYLGLE